jgi:hypothetical protein
MTDRNQRRRGSADKTVTTDNRDFYRFCLRVAITPVVVVILSCA